MIIYGINPVLEALRAGRVKELRVGERTDQRLRELLALADSAWCVCGEYLPMSSIANRGAAFTSGSSRTSRRPNYTVDELVRCASVRHSSSCRRD